MTQQTTILLSKKGMKELKRSIAKLEHRQADLLNQLRDIDKTDSHEGRLTRSEKLAELEIIESQLADKQLYFSNAKLFPRKRDAIKVAIGSVVELVDLQGRMVRYTIVESIEANPSDGRISIKSPLGQSLVGKTIRDTIEWGHGLRTQRLQLVRIM